MGVKPVCYAGVTPSNIAVLKANLWSRDGFAWQHNSALPEIFAGSVHRRIGAGRGAIEAQAIYSLSVFLQRLGIGRHSSTALRRQGRPVHAIGTRLSIDGAEAIDTLRRIWAADQRLDPF